MTGVFDVLHIGHTRFLQHAREFGTGLVVGVESDRRVATRKGPSRPVVPAAARAELLCALAAVDGVFVVDGAPELWSAAAYAALMRPLGLWAIAFTADDPAEPGRRAAAQLLGIDVIVAPLLPNWSSSDILARGSTP